MGVVAFAAHHSADGTSRAGQQGMRPAGANRPLRFGKSELANAAKLCRKHGVLVKLERDGSPVTLTTERWRRFATRSRFHRSGRSLRPVTSGSATICTFPYSCFMP